MAIILFTDFGAGDIYVPQVKAVLRRNGAQDVVDLLHDAPAFNLRSSAHLLAALSFKFDPGSVFLAVVDPRVGSEREAAVVMTEGRWYVGPDNGLLSVLASRSPANFFRITWRPPDLSRSFHGRDLFAPIAAAIAKGEFPKDKVEQAESLKINFGAGDLAEVIYIDHYGNAITGLRAESLNSNARLRIGGHTLQPAEVFSCLNPGELCWYENSIGLIEIAMNRGNAAQQLNLSIGQTVSIEI
ncbi:MAG: SAM hydrolase/SAM-dependent halogenase family protein [Burkholderiales bacterium]